MAKVVAEAARADAQGRQEVDPRQRRCAGQPAATINNWAIDLGNSQRFAEAVNLLRAGLARTPSSNPSRRTTSTSTPMGRTVVPREPVRRASTSYPGVGGNARPRLSSPGQGRGSPTLGQSGSAAPRKLSARAKRTAPERSKGSPCNSAEVLRCAQNDQCCAQNDQCRAQNGRRLISPRRVEWADDFRGRGLALGLFRLRL